MDYFGYWQNDNERKTGTKNKFYLYTAVAIVLAALAGLAEPSGIFATASCIFAVSSTAYLKKRTGIRIAAYTLLCLIASTALCAAGLFALKALKEDELALTLVTASPVLLPYLCAPFLCFCLYRKKEPITTLIATVTPMALFTAFKDSFTIFISYGEFSIDAINQFTTQISEFYIEEYAALKITQVEASAYVSFVMRLMVSLFPGICILLSVIQVMLIIVFLKKLLKDKLAAVGLESWSLSLSLPSSIVNIVSIVIFMTCFYSRQVNPLTAVAGNFVLILAPISLTIGTAYLLKISKGQSIFNKLLLILPVIMLFLSPVAAIIYLSFVGSFCVLSAKLKSIIPPRPSDDEW